MGGEGSGRREYGGRWTVETSQRWRLSISTLTQAGYLSAGGQRITFYLNWLPLTVDIDLGAKPHIFIQDTRETIGLDWSPVYFGGRRWYFTCQGCLRRCRDLYLSKLVYACRVCSELTYDSVKHPKTFKNFYEMFAERRGVGFYEGRREVKEYERKLRRERKGKWVRKRARRRG